MKVLANVLIAAGILCLTSIVAPARAAEAESKDQITILYDAFGSDPSMTKDWGFSALVFLHSNFDGLGVAVRLAPAGPWDQRGPR